MGVMLAQWSLLPALCMIVSGDRLALNVVAGGSSQVVHLFSNSTAADIGAAELNKAFELAYGYFEKAFDAKELRFAYELSAWLPPFYCTNIHVRTRHIHASWTSSATEFSVIRIRTRISRMHFTRTGFDLRSAQCCLLSIYCAHGGRTA